MPIVAFDPVRSAASPDQIVIRKVAEPGGWLSNMSPHPIEYRGLVWWHSEALFQALRFAPDDEGAREAVRESRSPMRAKMIAKRFKARHMVRPLSDQDVENMRLCIRLKLASHPELRRRLIASGESLLVEDCNSRGRRANNLFGAPSASRSQFPIVRSGMSGRVAICSAACGWRRGRGFRPWQDSAVDW